jgi:hypothetical protein
MKSSIRAFNTLQVTNMDRIGINTLRLANLTRWYMRTGNDRMFAASRNRIGIIARAVIPNEVCRIIRRFRKSAKAKE